MFDTILKERSFKIKRRCVDKHGNTSYLDNLFFLDFSQPVSNVRKRSGPVTPSARSSCKAPLETPTDRSLKCPEGRLFL